jgi:excinuclease ABC subunit C
MTQQEFSKIAATIPLQPGIYKYYDADGGLLYVGKAKSLRKRVSSYFSKNFTSYKTHELVQRINKIEFTIVNWKIPLSKTFNPSLISTLKMTKPIRTLL